MRKEIKMLVLFAICYAITFRTCMLSNQYIAAIIQNGLLRMLLHVFYELYTSYSACYVWLSSFSKMNASFLTRCALVSKRKKHTFGTFTVAGQTISPSSSSFKRSKCNTKINLAENRTKSKFINN